MDTLLLLTTETRSVANAHLNADNASSSPSLAGLKASLLESGIWVLTEMPVTPLSTGDVLVVTDSEREAAALSLKGFPVVGYEHGEIRLSCPEIICSLEALTPEYCRALHRTLTGTQEMYSDSEVTLYRLSENEFLEAFETFRLEPYMLRASEKNYTENDVRTLYKTRLALSQFTANCGSFRVVTEGETVGYGSVFEETVGEGLLTTNRFFFVSAFWGRHLGRAIVNALVSYARTDDPVREINAFVHPDNTASAKLLLSCGFQASSLCAAKNARSSSNAASRLEALNECMPSDSAVFTLAGRSSTNTHSEADLP